MPIGARRPFLRSRHGLCSQSLGSRIARALARTLQSRQYSLVSDHGLVHGAASFIGIHIAVADMANALDFYRRAGLIVPDGAEAGGHVEIDLGGGAHLALSTPIVLAMYDEAWRGLSPSTASVLQLQLSTRDAVDDIYAALTSAGYHGHLPPIDAFWGNRYCEVDDADGHTVGFHSPTDDSLRN